MVSPRFSALWDATSGVQAGMADRLVRVRDVLRSRRPDIASIRLFQERDTLLPIWAMVFAALEEQGVKISIAPEHESEGVGDLLEARSGAFIPEGDNSLVLLRPHGQLAAAEEVAASLAQLASLDGVVRRMPNPRLAEQKRNR